MVLKAEADGKSWLCRCWLRRLGIARTDRVGRRRGIEARCVEFSSSSRKRTVDSLLSAMSGRRRSICLSISSRSCRSITIRLTTFARPSAIAIHAKCHCAIADGKRALHFARHQLTTADANGNRDRRDRERDAVADVLRERFGLHFPEGTRFRSPNDQATVKSISSISSSPARRSAGPPRCITSCRKHPQIAMPDKEELHFFDDEEHLRRRSTTEAARKFPVHHRAPSSRANRRRFIFTGVRRWKGFGIIAKG